MEKSYSVIQEFIEKNLNNKKVTFFTTGTVARSAPDLLKRIHNDGHEIASHYNFHDLMFTQDIQTIEINILEAKNSIFKAVGEEPVGFRAPVFSIPKNRLDIFELLSKHFSYDSSYVLKLSEDEYQNYQEEVPFNIDNFLEVPVLTKKYFHHKLQMKSGGTFFRFFTKKMIKETMLYSHDNGYPPLIYLHPYDYLQDREFWVDSKYFLKNINLKNSIKYFRQIQWIGIGNKSVFPKLEYLLEHFEHQGPMKILLDK